MSKNYTLSHYINWKFNTDSRLRCFRQSELLYLFHIFYSYRNPKGNLKCIKCIIHEYRRMFFDRITCNNNHRYHYYIHINITHVGDITCNEIYYRLMTNQTFTLTIQCKVMCTKMVNILKHNILFISSCLILFVYVIYYIYYSNIVLIFIIVNNK